MAFFKLRTGGGESPATLRQPESIEAMRRRARHRLIGAIVLVLLGVIGFPLLFDTQPRPIAVDIPIQIPDRNKVPPLAGSTPAPAVSGPVTAPPLAPAMKAEVPPLPKIEPPPEPKSQAANPEPKASEPKAAVKAEPKSDDGAKALALLEGKPVSPGDGRFVVQVGAFADAALAREARQKVERAGLKTYTHVAETKEGKRIRVRVGPFGTRAEADKAADKVKGLDLPAAILTL